jgi:hypothetical protein
MAAGVFSRRTAPRGSVARSAVPASVDGDACAAAPYATHLVAAPQANGTLVKVQRFGFAGVELPPCHFGYAADPVGIVVQRIKDPGPAWRRGVDPDMPPSPATANSCSAWCTAAWWGPFC